MKFIGIIPARYASTRFPGKPLAMLGGKPVIQHVYEKWLQYWKKHTLPLTTNASSRLLKHLAARLS